MSLDLDIPALLAPFEGESPAGADLREDADPNNAYRKIRDTRSDAKDLEDEALLEGEPPSEAKRVWQTVWSSGQDYLQSNAKDLEIVAYMIEAAIRVDEFAGLEAALTLTSELVENFWGELLPTPDEDGIETTLLPIARLNSNAITSALQQVPITEDTSAGEMTLMKYAQAKRLDGLDADERDRQLSRGAMTTAACNQAVSETSDAFLQALNAQLETTLEAVDRLDAVFIEKAGEQEAPNLSRFRESLQEAASTLQAVAGHRLATDDASEADEAASEDGSGAVVAKEPQGIRGQIANRQDALDVLEKAAAWFEQHEPQSLLISEIRKVRRRALMTPEELYKDLISDSSVREQLFRDVGIEASSEYDE